ncbi:VQ motif-containing protein 13-like [Brassica napus]|uniref:VQ motif-containing protein 13-like n=1 Tax=Brassica napus TaxID=3708 RepID=UPI002078F318|nr:VQ motif-containing protein 13-like [Brassica napus]
MINYFWEKLDLFFLIKLHIHFPSTSVKCKHETSFSTRASMKNSPRYKDNAQSSLPSPSSISSPTRHVTSMSERTTFFQTDASSFKQVVQMLTGSSKKPNPNNKPKPRYSIPPVKASPSKKLSSSSSDFRLYERRNSKKHLKIHPVHSGLPEKLSPSILDFPSLVLSPDTPLIPVPFIQTGSLNKSPSSDAEERAMKEKGFYLHPSPSTTPRVLEPRLLPLFPLTSPRVSDSVAASTTP